MYLETFVYFFCFNILLFFAFLECSLKTKKTENSEIQNNNSKITLKNFMLLILVETHNYTDTNLAYREKLILELIYISGFISLFYCIFFYIDKL